VNTKRLLLWTIIGTGVSSVSTELLVVREFLTQFHGNEITISVVFFAWLLLTGVGSLIARLFKHASSCLYLGLLLAYALWPLGELILIRYLREVFFLHGVSPGFYAIIIYITIVSAPYCLVTGFVLPYSQKVINAAGFAFDSGQLYQTDNIGDILGGAIFSFVLVYWFTPFVTVFICSLCLLASIISILLRKKRYVWLVGTGLLVALFALVCMNRGLELKTLKGQYGHVARYLESPYGRIVITQETGQHTFWESGTPLYSDGDIMRAEEKVHYAMCQRAHVSNVLLISGGLGETLTELAKYRPRRVDYVELDPKLTWVASQMGVVSSRPWLHIVNTDGRLFLKQTKWKYDVIIVDLPDPDTFQINRFFTREFLGLAKKRLTAEGVLSLNMEYSQNFISSIRKKKLASLYRTAKTHFNNILVIPGGQAFFMCSDGPLSADIPGRLNRLHIKTSYVEGFYYGNITPDRLEAINRIVHSQADINSDFRPILMRITLREWFLKQGSSPGAFVIGFAIAVAIYLMFLKKEEYVLFTTGLSNMGTEMLVVYGVQVLFGYVYVKIGAIVTAFLLGLLPGAALGNKFKNRGRGMLLYSDMALVALLGMYFIWCFYLKMQLSLWVFLVYGVIFSVICGFQFPLVAHIIGEDHSPAAGCLAADLAGAAVGTFLVGTILVPMWGMTFATLVLILLKGGTTMFLFKSRRAESWAWN